MYKVIIRFGPDQIERTYDAPVTIRQLRNDYNVKAALGYGDAVKFTISGIEMPDEAQVPNNGTVVVETRANSKATS